MILTIVLLAIAAVVVATAPAEGGSVLLMIVAGVSFLQKMSMETDEAMNELVVSHSWDGDYGMEAKNQLGTVFMTGQVGELYATKNDIVEAFEASAYAAGKDLAVQVRAMVKILNSYDRIPVFMGRDGDLLLYAYRKLGGKHGGAILAEGISRKTDTDRLAEIVAHYNLSSDRHVYVDTGFAGSIFRMLEGYFMDEVSGVLLSKGDSAPDRYISCGGEGERTSVMVLEHAPRPVGYQNRGLVYWPKAYKDRWDLWEAFRKAFIAGVKGKASEGRRLTQKCLCCGKTFPKHRIGVFGLCWDCIIKSPKAETAQCNRCGKTVGSPTHAVWENSHEDFNGYSVAMYCDDCFGDHAKQCDCGAYVRRSHAINGKCPRCAFNSEEWDDIHTPFPDAPKVDGLLGGLAKNDVQKLAEKLTSGSAVERFMSASACVGRLKEEMRKVKELADTPNVFAPYKGEWNYWKGYTIYCESSNGLMAVMKGLINDLVAAVVGVVGEEKWFVNEYAVGWAIQSLRSNMKCFSSIFTDEWAEENGEPSIWSVSSAIRHLVSDFERLLEQKSMSLEEIASADDCGNIRMGGKWVAFSFENSVMPEETDCSDVGEEPFDNNESGGDYGSDFTLTF